MLSHTARPLLRGLYIILDPGAIGPRSLGEVLDHAVAGGARLFQYRDKAASGREAYRRAMELRRITADAGALFLVNDRCDLALAVDADGVHLGQNDLPVSRARAILGPDKIIGLSTHTPHQVSEATRQEVDYLGFGPIFPTGTKPDHEPLVGLEGLAEIRRLTSLPIFGIGGVTVESTEAVIRAGANGVAVVSAIWRSPDIRGTVQAFIACVQQGVRPDREP
ncbi:MAG TPA: thiamine phosphate synthase [Nitrospiraceae bacterium]|nr:thiamine phosphate synthase [Nitrospiraceae bacterium]